MEAKVAVFGTLRFPPDRMAELRPHIKALVEETYRNDQCIAYDVAEDLHDPGLIRFSELWPDRETLDKHLRAPHIEPWRVAAKVCGLAERKFTAYGVSGTWPV